MIKEILNARKKIAKHQQAIKEVQQTISVIQNACTHPKETLKVEYKSNTGNYDPSCDSYWTVNDCELCGKHWMEDQ